MVKGNFFVGFVLGVIALALVLRYSSPFRDNQYPQKTVTMLDDNKRPIAYFFGSDDNLHSCFTLESAVWDMRKLAMWIEQTHIQDPELVRQFVSFLRKNSLPEPYSGTFNYNPECVRGFKLPEATGDLEKIRFGIW